MKNKRNLNTILADAAVGFMTGLGGFELTKMVANGTQTVMKKFGPDIVKYIGKVGSAIVEYGPTAVVGITAIYAACLSVTSVDKNLINKQLLE